MRLKLFYPFIFAALMGAALAAAFRPAQAAHSGVIYVDAAATGAASGLSWTDAYTNMQDALAHAASGDQIWVAKGVYYPDEGAGQVNNDRTSTFTLINGVAIYGGFAGDETQLSQRDPAANVTVLSGDIDHETNPDVTDANGVVITTTNINGDNAYHVINYTAVISITVLDGFTVTAGQADGSLPNNRGGGIYNSGDGLAMADVTISGNLAGDVGGGMSNVSSNPALTGVTFSGNSAGSVGGGMSNVSSSPALINTTFISNSAGSVGGGMFNFSGSSPALTNGTFSGNSAGDSGGGIYNSDSSSPALTNVTFSGNSADFGGGMLNASSSSPALINTTFISNTAISGGGMYNFINSSPVLTIATFFDNSADFGGGMLNASSSSPALTNVTFSGNSAGDAGGGMYNSDSGSVPTLTNVIIANSANGGDCVNGGGASLNAASQNNLIENSGNDACGLTDGVDGNIIGQDPSLGPLTDYGGPGRQTLPLLPGSPAVDAGTNTGCPAADQRGAARPYNGVCDIGAYEATYSLAIAISVDDDAPSRGQTITFTIVAANTGSAASGWVISDMLPAGLNFLGPVALDDPSGTGTAGSAPPLLAAGLSLPASAAVTVTFPVTISYGLAPDASLTNTAAVNVAQIVTPTTDAVVITVANQAPIADAGPDQSMDANATVTLDGSGSSDPDGDALSYFWQQTGGPAVTLSDPTAASPTFTAPGAPAMLAFTLTVTDSFGLASAPDSVVVAVQSVVGYIYLPLVINEP